MTYELDLEQTSWNLQPQSAAEEILQNVRCLLATAKGTCWLYREFGIDASMIDKPLNVAKTKFIAEVARVIAKYEPRCRLKRIDWLRSEVLDGQLKPRIIIDIP